MVSTTTIAVIIFVAAYALIITEKVHRTIVGIVGPDTPRDVLGLMMAGVSYEDAVATVEESHE